MRKVLNRHYTNSFRKKYIDST